MMCVLMLTSISIVFASEEQPVINPIDQVITDTTNAIINNPNDAIAYCRHGNAYREKVQYDLAIDDLNKAIEINPKYTLAYFNLGQAYEKKALYQDAINAYRRLILNATLPQDQKWVNSAQMHIRECGGTL